MIQHCYSSVDYTELYIYKGRKKELDTGYQTNLNGSKLSAAFPVFAYSMGQKTCSASIRQDPQSRTSGRNLVRTTTNLQTRKQVGGERRKSQETRNTLSSEAAYKLLKRFRSNIKEIAKAINNKDIVGPPNCLMSFDQLISSFPFISGYNSCV